MPRQIAIIGGAEPNKAYEPPVLNHMEAIETARLLGAALARANYRILVYWPGAIEAAAVSGFLSEKPSAVKSIIVVFSKKDKGPKAFAEYAKKKRQPLTENPMLDVHGELIFSVPFPPLTEWY